jgi:hypothetical protein
LREIGTQRLKFLVELVLDALGQPRRDELPTQPEGRAERTVSTLANSSIGPKRNDLGTATLALGTENESQGFAGYRLGNLLVAWTSECRRIV